MTPDLQASVLDLVAASAVRGARRTAVVDRMRRLSYGVLVRDANRLAHHLITKPVRPGDVVALALEPSCELAVALLAVWKAGAIALPMDPSFPAARLRRMLEDAGSRHVVTRSTHAQLFRGLGAIGVHLDAEQPWVERQPGGAPAAPCNEVACLLYTSGSTGRPKGVAIRQRALVNKLVRPGPWGTVDAHCRSAWHSSPAFDASLGQLLLPLAHGGSVRALDGQERLDARQFWPALAAHGTTVLDATPSWLLAMLPAAPPQLTIERIVLGGEILTPALARALRQRFPAACIVNAYGPTEACIDATAHELSAADLQAHTVPIGKPLPGYHVRLVNDRLGVVTDGDAGELCIGGIGVADGYWKQPEASAERFVDHPELPGERLYRTGDLARRRADGALEFLGRCDQQVKLRGQRIELGEIEALLARQPGVRAAAVRLWAAPGGGEPIIVAYAVLTDATPSVLREQMRSELPAFMVPTQIVAIDELPLLVTGKVDRDKLPAPTVAPTRPPAPGRDAFEADLLALWCEVLERDVGVDDNFFEVGGDSLSAVELTLCIGERLGVALTLATLLAYPTVADLTLALLRGRHADGGGRVLRLSGADSAAPPLFLLPPGSGAGLVYAGLARELSGCLPCHAFQAVGLDGGAPGSHTMEALAAQFVADVHRLQPIGDIQLCGYSAGGPVAHEMARQLADCGRRVSRLVLLDPHCADHSDLSDGAPPETGPAVFRNACRDMLWDAFGVRGTAAEPVLAAAERLRAFGLARPGADLTGTGARRALAQARQVLPPRTDLQVFLLLLEGVDNLCHAGAGHRLRPLPRFDGEAWFIQPSADAEGFRQARRAHWQRLVGVVLHTHVVPGEHATLLQRAATVSAIGALLKAAFEPVREAA